jgi:peptidoglycan L-alanyl-D-glutamate endopeptidase CwlK
MASRDLKDLLPGTKKKVQAWLDECAITIKQPVFIVCTYRSQFEQDGEYAKGRTAPGPVVTWTKHSKHTVRRAVDFALKMPNPWDIKADLDADDNPDYIEVGRLAEKHGLQWGVMVDGMRRDWGHLQDNEVYSV